MAEIGRSVAGAYVGKLFADYGSEVHISEAMTPSATSAFFDDSKHLNSTSVLDAADVVIQSSPSDPIESPLAPINPEQVVLRISPFPSEGPYSKWKSTDLVDAALGGHLRLTGDPSREPLSGVPDLVHMASGATGFIGVLAALMTRARTGQGQIVEVSHQEVIASLHQFSLLRYTHNLSLIHI